MASKDGMSFHGSLDRRRLLLGLAGASLAAPISGRELDAIASAAAQSDLLTGRWQLHANNTRGTLSIESVDPAGLVRGEVLGRPIEGFWDSSARKLTFLRRHESDDWARTFTFTGYLMGFPSGGADVSYALGGTFQRLSSARQTAFGWYATISVIG